MTHRILPLLLLFNTCFAYNLFDIEFEYEKMNKSIMGYYEIDTDRIVLNYGLTIQEKKETLYHENCHRVWVLEYTYLQRELYVRRFWKKKVSYPTWYSKTSPEENFAENCMIKKLLNE